MAAAASVTVHPLPMKVAISAIMEMARARQRLRRPLMNIGPHSRLKADQPSSRYSFFCWSPAKISVLLSEIFYQYLDLRGLRCSERVANEPARGIPNFAVDLVIQARSVKSDIIEHSHVIGLIYSRKS